jgi:hypothetical protein
MLLFFYLRKIMFVFINRSHLPCKIFYFQAIDRKYYLSVVQKETYDFNAKGQLEFAQSIFHEGEDYGFSRGHYFLKQVSDKLPYKYFPELILQGHVPFKSADQKGKLLKLSLLYADGKRWQKRLLVQGPRYWSRRYRYKKIMGSDVLEDLSLDYCHSFGGCSGGRYEENNPVGLGYLTPGEDYFDRPLPLLEYECDRLKEPYSRIKPACFAPIAQTWLPRKRRFSRYVSSQDFLMRYQMAPTDQYLRRFHKPRFLHFSDFYLFSRTQKELSLPLSDSRLQMSLESESICLRSFLSFDTVVINLDKKQIEISARASLPWPQTEKMLGIVRVESV